VPLLAQGEALGVLHLRKTAGPGERPGFNDALTAAAGEQIALGLANVKLRETLRNQSVRDPLTDLFNRRYMEETLEREIRRAERSGRPLSVVILDLDHFKQFNDTFGHDAGDLLLREVGAFLKEHIRSGDIACRFGGEEFVLILPESEVESTRARAEQLREELKRLSPQHRGQTLRRVSMSLGVAAWEESLTAEALLRAADQALYRAKKEGRDRTVVAAPLSAGPLP
jgi:diguanylate cyclase (GGDEF)-like protein